MQIPHTKLFNIYKNLWNKQETREILKEARFWKRHFREIQEACKVRIPMDNIDKVSAIQQILETRGYDPITFKKLNTKEL